MKKNIFLLSCLLLISGFAFASAPNDGSKRADKPAKDVNYPAAAACAGVFTITISSYPTGSEARVPFFAPAFINEIAAATQSTSAGTTVANSAASATAGVAA